MRQNKINSKAKGSRFERDIAKKLGLWYYEDENAIIRNFSSGALSTVRPSAGLPSGDLQQVKYMDKPFPYSVEAKHHKEFKIEHLIFNKRKSKVYRSWVQCRRDAQKDQKLPLLIFRANYQNVYCVLDISAYGPRTRAVLAEILSDHCMTKEVLIVSFKYFVSSKDLTTFLMSTR